MQNLMSVLSNRNLVLPALLAFWLSEVMTTPGNSLAYKVSSSLGSGMVYFVAGYIFIGFVLLQIMISVYYLVRPNAQLTVTQITRVNFTALSLALLNAAQLRLVL